MIRDAFILSAFVAAVVGIIVAPEPYSTAIAFVFIALVWWDLRDVK